MCFAFWIPVVNFSTILCWTYHNGILYFGFQLSIFLSYCELHFRLQVSISVPLRFVFWISIYHHPNFILEWLQASYEYSVLTMPRPPTPTGELVHGLYCTKVKWEKLHQQVVWVV